MWTARTPGGQTGKGADTLRCTSNGGAAKRVGFAGDRALSAEGAENESMPWVLPEHEHRKFERNTIALTVAQLRFHPILKIRERLPAFQDGIRVRYPGFRTQKVQDVVIEPEGIRVGEQEQFQFLTADSSATVSLGSAALSLENRRHQHHGAFIQDFKIGLDALQSVFSPVSPTRLGLRYINVIDRERISKDLGRDLAWTELIQASFLNIPHGLASLEGTQFSSEISSAIGNGEMTVRHGLLRDPGSDRVHFRLDVDRYTQETFEPDATLEMLESFASNIYSIFMSATGEGLREWMNRQGDGR